MRRMCSRRKRYKGTKRPQKRVSWAQLRHDDQLETTHHRLIDPKANAFAGSGGREQIARMPVIKVKDNESFEQAMKRFKKTCEKAGILTELRRREYYDKPSISKKKKAAAARKRALKKIRRMSH